MQVVLVLKNGGSWKNWYWRWLCVQSFKKHNHILDAIQFNHFSKGILTCRKMNIHCLYGQRPLNLNSGKKHQMSTQTCQNEINYCQKTRWISLTVWKGWRHSSYEKKYLVTILGVWLVTFLRTTTLEICHTDWRYFSLDQRKQVFLGACRLVLYGNLNKVTQIQYGILKIKRWWYWTGIYTISPVPKASFAFLGCIKTLKTWHLGKLNLYRCIPKQKNTFW